MKTSDLLALVFECAIDDRNALADAYGSEGEQAEAAFAQARAFAKLRDKLLPGRGPSGIRALIAKSDARSVGLKELRELSRQEP